MDRLRQHLLAGSGLAEQQNRGAGLCNLRDVIQHAQKTRRLAD